MMDIQNDQKVFWEKFKEGQAKFCKRPNILICGYTGSGKSSLVRTILGDVVPSSAIGNGAPKTMGYDCYENDLVRIWDSKGLELGETEKMFVEQTRNFIREKQEDPDIDNHIHLVWYTIQGPGARVTDCDKNLITTIFSPKNVIVVITKTDITRENQRDALKEVILDARIPEERILFTCDEEGGSSGCKELMLLSYKMLPDAYKDAFMEAQRIDLEAKIKAIWEKAGKAKTIASGAAASAALAAGTNPLPLSDAVLLIPIQLGMIGTLASLYGLKSEALKHTALPLVTKVVGMYTASTLLKFFPFIGNAINAGVAGALTGVMGLYVRKLFEESAIAKVKGLPPPEQAFNLEDFKMLYDQHK